MNGWIFAIADDLTGALEAGAKFAARGLTVRVTTELSLSTRPGVQVLAMDTETRHLSAAQAAEVVAEAAANASRFRPALVYKKTDSTLRGNIAAELRALQDVFPDRSLIYAPAYPEMGRTVKNGRLLVWGTPVHKTVFAADIWNPVRASDISSVLGSMSVQVLDGESSTDLQEAARLVMTGESPPFAAGPAALAGALAEHVASPAGTHKQWPSISRCLVVNGSLHPTSGEQLSCARTGGVFDQNWNFFDCDLRRSGVERAVEVGERICRLLDSWRPDALIIFGGDTTWGIHQALGAPEFEPYGEIVPGVPLSCGGGLFWITKAGGFGEPDILYQIRKRLT